MILEKYTKMEHPLLTFTSNEKLITIYESNKGNDIFFVTWREGASLQIRPIESFKKNEKKNRRSFVRIPLPSDA